MEREKIKYIANALNSFQVKNQLLGACKYLNLNIYFRKMPENINAVTLPASAANSNFITIINRHHNLGRLRFTIAHEIGHVALGHFSQRKLIPSIKKTKNNILDREANIFASEFLMPADIVTKMVAKDGANVEKLRKFFKVSKQTIRIRLSELAL